MQSGSNRIVPAGPILLLAALALFSPPPAAAASPLDFQVRNERGGAVRLGSLRGNNKVVVLFFAASPCPITSLYWDRIKGAWYNHRDRGVTVVCVGGNADDTPEKLRRAMEERDLELPLVWDENHALARSLGIDFTPLAVVLGRGGEVLYRGRLDDFWRDENRVRKRYLDDAIAAALEGRRSPDHLDEPFLGSRMR